MCGIAGFLIRTISWSPEQLDHTAAAMAARLAHRGPDDAGTWVDAAAGIALGHRRLAVVDLMPTGHQPMVSTCGRYVVVYNGELYNAHDLRMELETAGERFRGTSDTEVFLAAIARWGVLPALKRANAMFTLAVWDRRNHILYLARDRFGEKPLYYGWHGDVFLFGSELKALRAHPSFRGDVDRRVLAHFLRDAYVPSPLSIYESIHKVPPGCVVRVSRRGTDEILPYWSTAQAVEDALAHRAEPLTTGEFQNLLADAVRRRMVADVPLGALLSGGVDSTTIVALMQAQTSRPVRTFTVGFHETGFDEAGHARAVASRLGTDHTELYVTAEEAQAVIPQLPLIYDEPFADPSQIPTFLISQLARRSVTVALSGDAGDELFGGYQRYLWRSLWPVAARLPMPVRRLGAAALLGVRPERWRQVLALAARVTRSRWIGADGRVGERAVKLARMLSARTREGAYASLTGHWPMKDGLVLGLEHEDDDESAELPSVSTFAETMMYLDLVGYLPDDILVKVDRASMAVALEVRIPFLDHRVVEASWRLPLERRIAGGEGKVVLREVLASFGLRELVERPKAGFAVPVELWLRGPLREWAEDLLSEQRLRNEGYLDAGPIRRRWREHLTEVGEWGSHLWAVLMFQAWLEHESATALRPSANGETWRSHG
jgi:asparagine synthase (glutamine-hydrolysing)